MPQPDLHFSFHSRTPDATREAAGMLATFVGPLGTVISLNGDLGAGKTVFVKGFAAGLGLAADSVSSPTFTLVNEYPLASGERLVHADFYRFESEAALEGVGFLDYLEAGTVLVAEWGDRFPGVFPKDHLWLEIARPSARSAAGENRDDSDFRTIRVRALGSRAADLVQQWRQMLLERSNDDAFAIVCNEPASS